MEIKVFKRDFGRPTSMRFYAEVWDVKLGRIYRTWLYESEKHAIEKAQLEYPDAIVCHTRAD